MTNTAARLFERDGRDYRDPATVLGLFQPRDAIGDRLRGRASGGFWDVLADTGITLLVSREYEHLLVGLAAPGGRPSTTFLRVPHPSGIAVDRRRGTVHVALTRNPNQILTLAPAVAVEGHPLLPRASTFFPGATYMHDLALLGGELHANAVGENAVVRIAGDGAASRVWWPHCIESNGRPDFSKNWIQLNSIAAGRTVADSYFTASTAELHRFPPGHQRFNPRGRGVVFSGRTRDVLVSGLTRPHSARQRGAHIWVANSGEGEVVVADRHGRVDVIRRLPGWTRGIAVAGDVIFAATSRVLPRFRHYAPGVGRAVCGIHAVDARSGALLGSLTWATGNQVFAIDWLPSRLSLGFPYNSRAARGPTAGVTEIFYRGATHGVRGRG